MPEIAAVEPNGFRVVSTFSGCGGSCLGFKMAGYEVLWANEFIPAAQETYRANHPGTILNTQDIRTVRPENILEATGLSAGEVDVLEGSPPCASFSTAGKREAGWGKVKAYSETKQRVDDLFFEYIRILRGLRPKVFVAENVSGLVKGTAKGYFLEILRECKASGYRTACRVLDAQWLGVPQMRQRTIFVGVRQDLGLEPAYPKPFPYRYSVRDALPYVKRHEFMGPNHTVQFADGSLPAYTVSQMGNFSKKEAAFTRVEVEALPVEERSSMEPYAIGREWDRLGYGQKSEKYLNLIRPDPSKPCPTVTQTGGNPGAASVCHPTEKRKFSIAELRRICGFPDDFVLTGTFEQQWERLGRAVPPVMMYHIAKTIRDEILCRR